MGEQGLTINGRNLYCVFHLHKTMSYETETLLSNNFYREIAVMVAVALYNNNDDHQLGRYYQEEQR